MLVVVAGQEEEEVGEGKEEMLEKEEQEEAEAGRRMSWAQRSCTTSHSSRCSAAKHGAEVPFCCFCCCWCCYGILLPTPPPQYAAEYAPC